MDDSGVSEFSLQVFSVLQPQVGLSPSTTSKTNPIRKPRRDLFTSDRGPPVIPGTRAQVHKDTRARQGHGKGTERARKGHGKGTARARQGNGKGTERARQGHGKGTARAQGHKGTKGTRAQGHKGTTAHKHRHRHQHGPVHRHLQKM